MAFKRAETPIVTRGRALLALAREVVAESRNHRNRDTKSGVVVTYA